MVTEAETRQRWIDRQLAQAGWGLEQKNLVEEFLLGGTGLVAEGRHKYVAGDEMADYVLLNSDGTPMALVEAKRFGHEARAGERQASDYADRIKEKYGFDPFIFLTNGQAHWFWDRERAAPREVAGFFTREDLDRYAFQRRYRHALAPLGVDGKIVERDYQRQAIREVTEKLTEGQRKFLLVMATGTGKTRTVIALVDLLMRANWAQRVLFLADRRELVGQALGEFKFHLARESRARIEGGIIDQDARIHFSTYPSMMQVYSQLSPGYYDLIIADESHRSIYRRYRSLFTYFDAVQLGLTATPTEEIDHNTFELFQCPDGLPTFTYLYETAVSEGHLVPYQVLAAQTGFQLSGIKAGELPPEFQQQIEDQGIDLEEIDFEGSDLERRVTNSGTNDALVQEFMKNCRKDAGGTLPAKTIIFAISHAHAMELEASFRRLFPDLMRRGLAKVIDSRMERSEETLADFKRRDMPRVAISVDMLDTGIDVPAIQNLVFAKPVFSRVKFWQMIGRGTRQWTDPLTGEQKKNFLIIDHWNNFAYFQMNPDGETAGSTVPLPVRLFRARVETLVLLRTQLMTDEAEIVREQLQAMLALVPRDTVNVRLFLVALTELDTARGWEEIGPSRLATLQDVIAPLLRFVSGLNLMRMQFELHCARLAISYLSGLVDEQEAEREKIVTDLRALPQALPEVEAQAEAMAWMTSTGFWEHLDYDRVRDLETTWAGLMHFRQHNTQSLIRLTLPDKIKSRRWVVFGPTGEGAFADTYRQQVEAYMRDLSSELPGLIKLRRGETLSDGDLAALEVALNREDLFVSTGVLREVYERPDADLVSFLLHILNLEPLLDRGEQIRIAFDAFIKAHPQFTATQINFMRTVRAAALRGVAVTAETLARPPFSRVGPVEVLFTPVERAEIVSLSHQWLV